MSDPKQRRNNPRLPFSCIALFRDPQMPDLDPQHTCVTRDFSRDGVYFIADDRGLHENMQLLMRFPDSLATLPSREYLVQVRRMQRFPAHLCGVGARLVLRAMLDRSREVVAPRRNLYFDGMDPVPRRVLDLYA